MRKLIFLLLVGTALAQNVRYDAPFPSVSSSTVTPFLVANTPPNSPVLAVCHSPANAVPCTNFATVFTSLGVACSNGAQDTPQPQPSACQSTGDAQGNIGFWAPPGTYDYTVCVGISCFGPYTVTLGSTPGTALTLKTNSVLNGSQTLLNLIPGTNVTITDNGSGGVTIASSGGGGGSAGTSLDNCTTDQTGNSFPSVTSLSNYFYSTWSFIFAQASYITCTVYVPTSAVGATIVLDIAANDSVAGHTANFQTCDQVINSGTINIGALTCAANQAFTTTSTAYNRVSLTYNVQSTLSNGSILVVKIATSTTGTAPTANMIVYPHFIL